MGCQDDGNGTADTVSIGAEIDGLGFEEATVSPTVVHATYVSEVGLPVDGVPATLSFHEPDAPETTTLEVELVITYTEGSYLEVPGTDLVATATTTAAGGTRVMLFNATDPSWSPAETVTLDIPDAPTTLQHVRRVLALETVYGVWLLIGDTPLPEGAVSVDVTVDGCTSDRLVGSASEAPAVVYRNQDNGGVWTRNWQWGLVR